MNVCIVAMKLVKCHWKIKARNYSIFERYVRTLTYSILEYMYPRALWKIMWA